ncbi:hypothetical protein ANCDUO_08855 [Ancylostoma duodenale]|uniref:Uncharacterized protein n=1 Tax=Ancylostoma duodenale TaxID=51022 RepID=A0A0C2GUS9_9BILA|nr:hypothetical protein ANCDUO_08855 [Ancylostoma duodenale]
MFSGINYPGSCRELKYGLAIRADKGSVISYPKRSMECESAAKSELPNLTNINHLRDLSVVDLKGRVAIGDLKVLQINRLILFTTYLSRLCDLGDVAQMYRYDLSIAVSELSRRFIDLKAFAVSCLRSFIV